MAAETPASDLERRKKVRRRNKRRRTDLLQALTNILYINIPVFDPEKLLGWMLNKLLPALKRAETVLFWSFTLVMLLAAAAAAGLYVAAPFLQWVHAPQA